MHFNKIIVFVIQLSVIVTANFEANDKYGSPSLAGCLRRRGTQPAQVLVTRESNEVKYDHLNDQTDSPLPFITPIAYIEVNNVADVSNSIICARELNIHAVARGGGHSYAKYGFGDNSTVIIDLRNLNRVTVHKPTKTATVGPGVLLAQLYWGIWSQSEGKFGVPSGICLTVGMGQPLGGGQGYFQKMYGAASDNIIGYEMVDANGHLRIVNNDDNQDLLWALRGAGAGNFGIVTSFKYRLFDAKDVKFRSIFFTYRLSEFENVFKAWDTWNEATQQKTVFSDVTVTHDGFTLLIFDFDYNLKDHDIEKLKRIFPCKTIGDPIIKSENFIDFIVFNPFSGVNITNVSELANVKRTDKVKNAYLVKSYFVDKTLRDKEIKALAEIITRIPVGVEWYAESYGGAVNRIRSDATAFVHRNSLYNIEFKTFSNDRNALNYVQEFNNFALKKMDNGQSYQNFADWQLKDYLYRYYRNNLQRLVRIKRDVDPHNFFHFPQSIPTFL